MLMSMVLLLLMVLSLPLSGQRRADDDGIVLGCLSV